MGAKHLIMGIFLFLLLPAWPGLPVALPVDRPASPAAETLLDSAGREFQAGRYGRALEMLKNSLANPALPAAARDKALRLAADCNYFLGSKGNSQLLLTAVDQYKIILKSYPDPADGNDVLYYNLAKSYETLNFHYESAGALESLILSYPDSPFLPEATFKLGSILNQTGKYNRALERLLAYLKNNPRGAYAKAANFMIGDCYYRLRKSAEADRLYDEARKKWPDLQGVSPATFMNMGNHYFTAGKFAVAFQLFSRLANLYPADESARNASYMMARSSEAMGATALALKLYGLCSERYPAASEGQACSLAMANLGVTNPGLKVPSFIMARDDYLQPLKTYDKILTKSAGGESLAAVLLWKGEALVRDGRLEEGFAAYLELLNRFPRGTSSGEGRKRLGVHIRSLVNSHYEKDDYLAVAGVFFQCRGKGIRLEEDFPTADRIGTSLLWAGLYDEAAELYEAMRRTHPDRQRAKVIDLALAKIDIAQNKDAVAEEKLLLLQKGAIKDRVWGQEIKITLADLYYKKGMFARANPLYADVLGAGRDNAGAAYRNYGNSLLAVNLPDKAIANYLTALKDFREHPKNYPPEVLADIYVGLGDAYYRGNMYQEGIAAYRQALSHLAAGNTEARKWMIYMIGRGSAELNDLPGAERSFLQVKENAVGDFWPKVADYAIGNSRSFNTAGNRQ